MKKHIEGTVFVAWILIAIAFLIDDVSTMILMNLGFQSAETNPIFQALPYVGLFFFIGISIYLFVGWSYHFVISKYRFLFKNRIKGHKTYDFFMFFFCLMLSIIVVVKISAGISNIYMIGVYSTDEGKILLDEGLERLDELKQENPEEYSKMMKDHYNNAALKISYIQMIIIGMLAYFLHRIGIRVRPSDLE